MESGDKRRQRQCQECGRRWFTVEIPEADLRRWRFMERKMSESKVSVQKLFFDLMRVLD